MLGVVAMVLVLRSTDVSNRVTIAIAGLTTAAAVPLMIGIVASFISRGRAARIAAGLIGATFLFITTPLDAVIGCGPADSHESSGGGETTGELTILTANVAWGTGQPDKLAKMIVETDADIVALQEVSSEVFDALVADNSLADYTYNDRTQTNALWATVMLAKFPASPKEESPGGFSRITTISFPSSTSSPINVDFEATYVHIRAPLTKPKVAEWKSQLGLLADLPVDTAAILIGDFNATEDQKPFRNVLDAGWTDVHQEKGCGLDATFPSKERFPIALMRLDHVLVTEHFEVVSVDVLSPPNGSDHNPVLTKVRLRQLDPEQD